jgi:hypothetical protein
VFSQRRLDDDASLTHNSDNDGGGGRDDYYADYYADYYDNAGNAGNINLVVSQKSNKRPRGGERIRSSNALALYSGTNSRPRHSGHNKHRLANSNIRPLFSHRQLQTPFLRPWDQTTTSSPRFAYLGKKTNLV